MKCHKQLHLLFLLGLSSFYGFSQGLELVKNFTSGPTIYNFRHNALGEMYTYEYGTACGSTTSYGNYFTKYDANKNCVWSVQASSSYGVTINQMVSDNSGNLIAIGTFTTNSNYFTDATKKTEVTNNKSLTIGTLVLTAPVIPATSTSYSNFYCGFIVKITKTGTVSWLKSIYAGNTNGVLSSTYPYRSIVSDVTLDASNNVYIVSKCSNFLYYDGVKRTTASVTSAVVRLNSTGTYSSILTSTGNLYGSQLLYNPTANVIVLAGYGNTSTTQNMQFGNGTVISDATASTYGMYVASISTGMSVTSQAYFKSTNTNVFSPDEYYDSYVKLANTGDSTILAVNYNTPFNLGGTSIDPAGNALLFCIKATAPNTVFWKRLAPFNTFNPSSSINFSLQKGTGNDLYFLSSTQNTYDFGNGAIVSGEMLTNGNYPRTYVLQMNARNGLADWAINARYCYNAEFNSFDSKLYFYRTYSPTSSFSGSSQSQDFFRIDKRLKITSVTSTTNACAGAKITADFASTQTPTAGNVYTLQLSDENGDFENPTAIGTLTSTAITGSIVGTVPTGIEGGTELKVRVVASAPAIIGAESATFVSIGVPSNKYVGNTPANNADFFNTQVCDSTDYNLVAYISNATTYKWQLDIGTGFVDLADDATYQGTKTNTLTVKTLRMDQNGYKYNCIAVNSACPNQPVNQYRVINMVARPTILTTVPAARCSTGTVTLAVTTSPKTTSSSIYAKWYDNVSKVLSSSSLSYTTPSISVSTTYFAEAYLTFRTSENATITCPSFVKTPVLARVDTMQSVKSTTNGARCGTGIDTLQATATKGVINWYNSATSTSLLSTGNSYVTPSLTDTAIYYVEATYKTCTSTPRTPVTAFVNVIPKITASVTDYRCKSGKVNLSATTDFGVVKWYKDSLTTTALSSTNSKAIYSPVCDSTTTFYMAAVTPTCTSIKRTPLVATVYLPKISKTVSDSVCDVGIMKLQATPNLGTVYWYESNVGNPPIWKKDSLSIKTPSLGATSTYYAQAYFTFRKPLSTIDSVCISNPRTPIQAIVNKTPNIPVAPDVANCGPGTTTLNATTNIGTVDWYNSSGTTKVGSGLSITSPTFASNTFFLAEAINHGCKSVRDTARVTVLPLPSFTVSGTKPSACGVADGSVTIKGLRTEDVYSVSCNGGTASKKLSDVNGNIVIPNLKAGLYANIVVIDEASVGKCSNTNVVGVSLSDQTAGSITDTVPASRCDSGTVVLKAVATGTGTINWRATPAGASIGTGATFTTPFITKTTTYYVDITDGVCSSAAKPVVATVNFRPTVSVTSNAICGTGTVALSASANLGTINWYADSLNSSIISSNATFTTPSISATRKYYVQANNAGCKSVGFVPVTATIKPIPTVTNPISSSRCGNGSVSISAKASTGTISWYNVPTGGTVLASTDSYTTPTNSSATKTYYAEAYLNNCVSATRTPIVATINPNPIFKAAFTNPSKCAVADGTITLTGLVPQTNYEVAFLPNASTTLTSSASGSIVKTGLLAGTYTVQLKTDKGCAAPDTSLSLLDPNAPIVSAGLAKQVCQGDNVTLTATNPNGASITWNQGVTDGIPFAASVTNTYKVTANLDGCIATDEVTVTVKEPQTIVFDTLLDHDVSERNFTLTASSSASLPVEFLSSDSTVVSISGNQARILSRGTVTITATQGGDNCYEPAQPIGQTIKISGKIGQIISFANVNPVSFGDEAVSLGATSNLGLPITYKLSDTTFAKLVSGDSLVAVKNGSVVVTAYQTGNDSINAANPVSKTVQLYVPPFVIVGKTKTEEFSQEKYKISPKLNGLQYEWSYPGNDTTSFFTTGRENNSADILFSDKSTDDTLRCKVYNANRSAFVLVKLGITISHPNVNQLPAINCDSIKSTQNTCSGNYIDGFQFGEIHNSNSGCSSGGYMDYSKSPYSSKLFLGESYNADFTIGSYTGNQNSNYVGIWIDYNNNGSFNDPSEFLLSAYNANSSFQLNNIIISPNSDYLGEHRLRIRVRTSGLFAFNESCIDYNETGETEDYKVTLVANDRLEAPVLLTPNDDGKNDLFVLKGIDGKKSSKLTILDRAGNVLHTEDNYTNTWGGKDSEGKILPRDTYYYVFVNGDNTVRGFFEVRY